MSSAAPRATPVTSVASVPDVSACTPKTRRSDGTARKSIRTAAPARKSPSTAVAPRRSDHDEAIGIAVQSTRSPSSSRCPEWPISVPERRARLDAAHDRPEPVGGFDVNEREAERPAERSRRDGADDDQIADTGDARVPADEGVADRLPLDRAADRAAPPDDVRVRDEKLQARAPHERELPRPERDRRAPGREEEHPPDGRLKPSRDHNREADRVQRKGRCAYGHDPVAERDRRSHRPPRPNDPLAKQGVARHGPFGLSSLFRAP